MTEQLTAARRRAFEQAFERAAQLQLDLGGTADDRDAILNFIGDADFTDALIFSLAPLQRADGRLAARELAELLIPEAELMIQRFRGRESVLEEYERALRRLRAVVADQDSGAAVPPGFRDAYESWWGEQIADGDVDAVVGAAREGLAGVSGEQERRWIEEIWIGWLLVEDQWRWQPALELLLAERISRAVAPIREAALLAASPAKRPFAAAFREYANRLESVAGPT